jgi:hypothetical protein
MHGMVENHVPTVEKSLRIRIIKERLVQGTMHQMNSAPPTKLFLVIRGATFLFILDFPTIQ